MSKIKPKLATAKVFRAVQVPGQITLYISGNKPTPRSRVWLEPSLLSVFPPEYILVLEPPEGPDIDVIVPFLAQVSFRAANPEKTVTVHDSKGAHKVKIEQALDVSLAIPARRSPKKK
jgi:hypothetical protein